MANIRGEGNSKGREMLVSMKLPSDSKIKDGVHNLNTKTAQAEIFNSGKDNVLLTIQMNNIGKDPADMDKNPYLYTNQTEDGKYQHGVFYSNKSSEGKQSQVQEMLGKCEKFSVERGFATFAVKGDVGIRKDGGLFVKTETMQPSEQPVTKTLNSDQFKATREGQKYAKEHQNEAEAKGAETKAAEAKAAEMESKSGAEMQQEEPQA